MGMSTRGPKESLPDLEAERVQDRRGRRLPLSFRMFFFGDDEFEGGRQDTRGVDQRLQGRDHGRGEGPDVLQTVPIFLPDFKWPLRIDQALVRWVDGNQLGLEFTSIRLAQRERLTNLIRKVRP